MMNSMKKLSNLMLEKIIKEKDGKIHTSDYQKITQLILNILKENQNSSITKKYSKISII